MLPAGVVDASVVALGVVLNAGVVLCSGVELVPKETEQIFLKMKMRLRLQFAFRTKAAPELSFQCPGFGRFLGGRPIQVLGCESSCKFSLAPYNVPVDSTFLHLLVLCKRPAHNFSAALF